MRRHRVPGELGDRPSFCTTVAAKMHRVRFLNTPTDGEPCVLHLLCQLGGLSRGEHQIPT